MKVYTIDQQKMREPRETGLGEPEDKSKETGDGTGTEKFKKWLDAIDEFSEFMFHGETDRAKGVQKKYGVGEKDKAEYPASAIPAAAFEHCLHYGPEKLESAFNIVREFEVPNEVVEERIDYFAMRWLVDGYAGLIFPSFEKYFSINDDRKRKIILGAINECGKRKKAEELRELFSELLGS